MSSLEKIGRMHREFQRLCLVYPTYAGLMLCAAAAAKVFREDVKTGKAVQGDSERYKMLGAEAFNLDINLLRPKQVTSKDG